MKSISLLCVLFLVYSSFVTTAQEAPQKVQSLVKVEQDVSWYIDQYNLWQKELQLNPKYADGWLSFYTAARMAKILSKDQESRNKWLKNMNEVVNNMEKNIKGTYEYYYIKGYNELKRPEQMTAIFKAYAMNPERADTYDELMTHYELSRNKAGLEEIAKKWAKTDDISPSYMLWNYNMLASTRANAILLTAGDMDTYPSLILQYAENFRSDVSVLNTSLLLLEPYRNKIFAELAIPALEGTVYAAEKIVAHIIKHKGDRPLFVSISCRKKAGIDEDKLYNVGLAMQYSEDGQIDHTSLLIKNFERHILLDHLTYRSYNEPFELLTKQFNFVYIPGLMMLHRHYSISNNSTKQHKIERLILKIIANTDQEDYIKDSLKKNAKC
jgi:hypothetical protein